MLDIQKVITWNERFGNPKGKINYITEKKMMQEEFEELCEAIKYDDRKEMVDAIIDMFVVGVGTMHKLGLSGYQIVDCFEEVCRSNDSKFPMKKNSEGKIMKGPNYEEPNLSLYLPEGF